MGFFFFQAEDGIRDRNVTEVQTCALPISSAGYEVLASFIEQATEMSFAEYVHLGICEPLGIEITVEGSAGRSEERRVGKEGRSRWAAESERRREERKGSAGGGRVVARKHE